MKVCSKCKENLPLSAYSKSRGQRHDVNSYCVPCATAYKKEKYKQNCDFVLRYLAVNCCIDCGESDILTLEFDHVSGEKKGNIASFMNRRLQIVKDEIEKCEVRCANCHSKKTHREANDARWQYSKIAEIKFDI